MTGDTSGWGELFPNHVTEDTSELAVFVPEKYSKPAPVEAAAVERAKSGPSQATELVRLARARYTVVRGDDSKTYAVAHSLPGIAFGLRGSAGLKQQLAAAYFDEKNQAASGGALTDALAVLEGDALRAEVTPVFLRIGSVEGSVIIDLGTPDGSCINVSPAAWDLVKSPPVLFRRNSIMLAHPTPTRNGDLGELHELLNLDESNFRLVVGWLIGAMLSDSPQPILALTGQQGTAKTSAAKLILSLLDPSIVSIRSQPRTEEDWAVGAFNAYGIGLDNVSSMPPWFQDALCKAVTGDALLRRERYSDDGSAALQFRRPIVITTIDPGALQGDVADRLLLVELQPIGRRQRMTDAEVTAHSERIRPGVLGALLDTLVSVLAALPGIELEEKPRMADFANMLAALDQVTGWDTLTDYLAAAESAGRDVIDGDSFAAAITTMVRGRGFWQGTCGELLAAFELPKAPADWPKTPRAVSAKLQRLTPAFATAGIEVTRPEARSNRGHLFTIRDLSVTSTLYDEEPF